MLRNYAKQAAQAALKCKLPTIVEFSPFVESGGLTSYGTDVSNLCRRATGYADKILKGARPADLPVEQPISSSS